MKELTLPASRTNIPAIIEFVNRELERMGCALKTKAQIDIAIDAPALLMVLVLQSVRLF